MVEPTIRSSLTLPIVVWINGYVRPPNSNRADHSSTFRDMSRCDGAAEYRLAIFALTRSRTPIYGLPPGVTCGLHLADGFGVSTCGGPPLRERQGHPHGGEPHHGERFRDHPAESEKCHRQKPGNSLDETDFTGTGGDVFMVNPLKKRRHRGHESIVAAAQCSDCAAATKTRLLGPAGMLHNIV